MAEPYHRPAPGARPRLYRLLRDNMYFTAGTIVALDDDQVSDGLHEAVAVKSDDYDLVMALTARVAALEAAQTPAAEPPPPPPEPEPEPPPEPDAAEPVQPPAAT